MSNRYQGRRRRHRRNLTPLLLGLILVLGIAAALHFTGVFSRNRTEEKDPAQQEQTDPGQTNPGQTDPEPVEPGQTDPEPVEPGHTDPEPAQPGEYEPIEVKGDQEQYEAVYRVGDSGFEMYTYVSDTAEKYARSVNHAAEQLQGAANVYAITVPLSSGITLPDDLLGGSLFGNQKKAEESVVSMLSSQIKAVPLYDTLMSHRTEYIYFRTDHHWTALGAYYGYRAFCQAKGITPHELTDYRMEEFPGFLGTFYKDSDNNEQMGDNPDTVVVYRPVTTTAQLVFTDINGQETPWRIIYDVSDWRADMKYNTFIGGDNPYTVINNPEVEDDSVCVVVKESFGNALVPYLVDHYHTVYVLDYRYWSGDLQSFVREQGAQDVVFINNLSAIRNNFLMGKLQEMVG